MLGIRGMAFSGLEELSGGRGTDWGFFLFFFFFVPQVYLWGSPLLGEIFAYVTVF